MAPMLAAIQRGKPVLVEKPIALTVREADQVLEALAKFGGNVRVGYSRRYKERYQIAKEQVVKGRIGTLTGGAVGVVIRPSIFSGTSKVPYYYVILIIAVGTVALCWTITRRKLGYYLLAIRETRRPPNRSASTPQNTSSRPAMRLLTAR
jgi:hypothetical protein